jgi:membrane protein insertase Oxa1/YidC/SpoIIIJ
MIISLQKTETIDSNKRFARDFYSFQSLIDALNKKDIPADLTTSINQIIIFINSMHASDKIVIRRIEEGKNKILEMVERRLGLVRKKQYHNYWITMGVTLYGLPVGVVLYFLSGNLAFIIPGLPIGMLIGIWVGNRKDRKAETNGKQLEIE